MNGIHSNSFIHFDELCVDLVHTLSFFRRNFCSRSRNFKIFSDLKTVVSRFLFKKFGELTGSLGIRSRAHFPYPLRFEIQNHGLTVCISFTS